jgi:hypothetical protein
LLRCPPCTTSPACRCGWGGVQLCGSMRKNYTAVALRCVAAVTGSLSLTWAPMRISVA